MHATARPHGSLFVAGALATAMFAACSEPPSAPATDVATAPAEPAPAAAASPSLETIGGDGSAIELKPLTEQDLAGKLPQELGCSFTMGDVHALLIAKGNVNKAERSFAVINNGGVAEDLQSTTTGGYDGMVEGVTFGGKGMTVEIAKGAEQVTGNETVQHAATLTAKRADGAERAYPGVWTCGP